MSRHGNFNFISVIQLISALLLVGITSTCAQAESIPTPKFFGVYALYDGKLTELKRHSQSNNYQISIGGHDVIQSVSNIKFPDCQKLKFILFSPQVANLTTNHFFVHVMATIRNAPPPSFHLLTQTGWEFRVAPVPNQPQMVQLIGPELGTSGGHLALMLNDGFYDYKITNKQPDPSACVERLVSYMGPSYQKCK